GQELGVVGGGGVLQQRVVALDRVELLQIASNRRVLVCVHHQDGAVVVDHLGQCAGFWRLQEQVVPVHVQAIGRDACTGGCPIGVGARDHHHVDAVQQGLQQPLCQFAADYQQGFAACGFVTVLLAYEHHGGAAAVV